VTETETFEVVKKVILEILPFLSAGEVGIDHSLKDLGANSIDRMEVVTQSMEELGLKIPMVEFGKVQNIKGLVELLHAGGA
jgi:polyketide biosynthesis acyl carrier protein